MIMWFLLEDILNVNKPNTEDDEQIPQQQNQCLAFDSSITESSYS